MRKPTSVTSLAFFDRLKWLDGRPLLSTIEPYRREIFTRALDTFDDGGTPAYSLVLAGRAKKNAKTLDLVLAALFVLVIRRSVQGSDGYILANDGDQAADDLSLARKLVAFNPDLRGEIEPLAKELRLKDGSASLRILPAKDIAGAHGKTASFVGFDEIWGYRDWSLLEALQPDPHRRDTLTWITSYASLYATAGAPLFDLMQNGKAGKDPRMLFSWYSGEFCTDPAFADLPPEQRANPSLKSFAGGYLEEQRLRLPTGRFRRLHLNLPGSPEGAAFDQGAILKCVVVGRRKLDRVDGHSYVAAVDMSHGSKDDCALCIAHKVDGRYVVDFVAKQLDPHKPFDASEAARYFAGVIKSWGIGKVHMDAAGGNTYREIFRRDGIDVEVITTPASTLFERIRT